MTDLRWWVSENQAAIAKGEREEIESSDEVIHMSPTVSLLTEKSKNVDEIPDIPVYILPAEFSRITHEASSPSLPNFFGSVMKAHKFQVPTLFIFYSLLPRFYHLTFTRKKTKMMSLSSSQTEI